MESLPPAPPMTARLFAVAPMMRYSHLVARRLWRFLCPPALLYTEMLTADSIIHGPRERLLRLPAQQRPTALQLGGSDPQKLALAAQLGEDFGYAEINLNCGCPSPRVRRGSFGACLMKTPQVVSNALTAMKNATVLPITVKCRIAVDDMDTESALDNFAAAVFAAGGDALIVHARRAFLEGLNPAQNRSLPPLDYDRARRLKQAWADKTIIVNGGIEDIKAVRHHLADFDGVMLGRAITRQPYLLAQVAKEIYGITPPSLGEALRFTLDGAAANRNEWGRSVSLLSGLLRGLPGNKCCRRLLSHPPSEAIAGLREWAEREYGEKETPTRTPVGVWAEA